MGSTGEIFDVFLCLCNIFFRRAAGENFKRFSYFYIIKLIKSLKIGQIFASGAWKMIPFFPNRGGPPWCFDPPPPRARNFQFFSESGVGSNYEDPPTCKRLAIFSKC